MGGTAGNAVKNLKARCLFQSAKVVMQHVSEFGAMVLYAIKSAQI